MTDLHEHVESMFHETVQHRRPIHLAEMGESALMERTDTKYLLTTAVALQVVAALPETYRVLDMDGVRLARYCTTYFDTPDFALYHAHHAGRAPRHKVRVREYVDSDVQFLEVKRRNNHGQTTKERIRLSGDGPETLDSRPMMAARLGALSVAVRDFPSTVDPTALSRALDVRYTRMTFVDSVSIERVTIDLGLTYETDGATVAFPYLAVLEIKQRSHRRSAIHALLRQAEGRPTSFSKYCVGLGSLHRSVKTNRYRSILRHLDAFRHPPVPDGVQTHVA